MLREFEKPVAGRPFRFGEWLVEPSLNRLSRGDTTIQLELKVMDVLVCLAERAGEVVPRQEIVDRVWATEFIADNTLTHAITEIRNAFGDDARNPSFIETIHRRGYRLIASIEVEVSDESSISKVARFPVPERAIEDDRNPYPGLAAFTEADTEFFFGRENEVAQMWRKLTSRRLLAVIGPSGVGKSSLLRAGVIPARPEGWGVVVCQPGEAPFAGLARALVPEFEGDREAISKLVYLTEPGETVAIVGRWRQQQDQALLVVDQFEELFTQNSPEAQASFAGLLRKLVDDGDVHVLLSMRDDFLYRCHGHDPLRPIFEDLSALEQPNAEALCRALVEPARRLGFSFEDDALPGEMVAEVEGERGALPLLAFAVARLWEKRDRENRLLTRQAYGDIGGVGGALARRAEATLKAVGRERLPIVRELFRNLVTSEGTRAVREADDLLSVFPEPQREDAQLALRRLIDARLLTSFEEEAVEGNPGHHRVEMVHESLLSSWPRLVGWQTQDADSARLRDELRQAARTWNEHNRTKDYLWTGRAFREFALWRGRYPGGLTENEEAFSAAMTALAGRRRRQRRMAVVAVLVITTLVTVVTTGLWRRSVVQERRAEAQKLIAVGQLELGSYPTAAVAHAIASLELADSTGSRQLALEALWKGPTAFIANQDSSWQVEFTPDGSSLIQSRQGLAQNLRIIAEDGSSELFEQVHEASRVNIRLSPYGDILYSENFGSAVSPQHMALWSIPDGRLLADIRYDASARLTNVSWNDERTLIFVIENNHGSIDAVSFDGTIERLGTLEFEFKQFESGNWTAKAYLDPRSAEWLGVIFKNEAYAVDIGDHSLSPPRLLGRYEGRVAYAACDPLGRFFAAVDESGEIRLWSRDEASPPTILEGPPGGSLGVTTDGSLLLSHFVQEGKLITWVWSLEDDPPRLLRRFDLGQMGTGVLKWDGIGRRVAESGPDLKIRLWPMAAPADAEPVFLLRGEVGILWGLSFHPQGRWLASADNTGVALWALARSYVSLIPDHDKVVTGLAFGPEGRRLSSAAADGTVRLWPLDGDVPASGSILLDIPDHLIGLTASPNGDLLLASTDYSRAVFLLPLEGGPPRRLTGFLGQTWGVAFSHDGRLAAAAGGGYDPAERIIRVWDVASGEEVTALELAERPVVHSLQFTSDGQLLSMSESGLLRWNIETGERELLFAGNISVFSADASGRRAIMVEGENETDLRRHAIFLELDSGAVTRLEQFGDDVSAVALDPTGAFAVTGDRDGEVRVGPMTGEEPHLLLGHESEVWAVAIDPLGRWIASGGQDTTIRLWPMPDLSKPPLHTLPHNELIAKLKTLTNLRVVRDEGSPTGWKLTVGPFPGWESVPSW